jgi:hypothetical protein
MSEYQDDGNEGGAMIDEAAYEASSENSSAETSSEHSDPLYTKGEYALNRGDHGTHIIELAGRKWMIGMRWSSKEDPQTIKEIKSAGARIEYAPERFGAQTAVQRVTDEVIQIGYGMPIDGLNTRGVRSLAASIADGVKQPWMGTYQIADDLFWYIAVRDGFAILPESDVVGTAEEILAAKACHRNQTYHQEKEGNLSDLEQLIEEVATNSPRLIRLDRNRTPLYASAALAIVAMIGGYHFYQAHLQREARMMVLEQRQHEAIEEQRIINSLRQLRPSPLLSIPSPDEVALSCTTILQAMPYAEDGWLLTAASCDTKDLAIRWDRAPGATLSATPQGEVSSDGENVVSTIPLQLPASGPDTAIGINVAVTDFRAMMQGANIKNTVLVSDPPAQVINIDQLELPGAKLPPPPPPPQAHVQFTWPANLVGDDWDRLPGFRILNMTHTKNGWDVRAIIYGRSKPPQMIHKGIAHQFVEETGLSR